MQIFNEIGELRAFLAQKKSSNYSIGFVPTMGALHQGHLALIQASKKENDITVCSIFVNPTQFNNPSDLEKYPRTLEKDIALLESEHCDVLFCPTPAEMYPNQASIRLSFGDLETVMEGKFRPGHFSGVALVVSKLLHIVEPTRAYFGQKDFQQLKIVEQLVKDLNFNAEIKSISIYREPDGLAMSSRNMRLNAAQREVAIIFYKTLLFAKEQLLEGVDFAVIQKQAHAMVEQQPGVKLEYLELADASNLKLMQHVTENTVLLIAGYVGEVRLIDNLLMNEN